MIKRIKTGLKRRITQETNKTPQQANRIHEINNLRRQSQAKAHGSRSSRDLGREGPYKDLKVTEHSPDITIDKGLEDIAKLEVDAFLNQGKLLTDKHLREVEVAIKSRWGMQNGKKPMLTSTNSKHIGTYLPNYSKSGLKSKDAASHTPKIGSNSSRRFISNYGANQKYANGAHSNDRYKKYAKFPHICSFWTLFHSLPYF